jgi:hypothetical protein
MSDMRYGVLMAVLALIVGIFLGYAAGAASYWS